MTDSEKLDLLLSKMSGIEQELGSVKQELGQKIESLTQKVTSVELTIENELRSGIKIIGEGHAILLRRLERAISFEGEKEMMMLRILSLETDVREIKESIKAS